MKNLRSIKALTGHTVRALDGVIGKIGEAYFDDAEWRIRYVVADIGGWMPGRRVLLPPSLVTELRPEEHELLVSVTREQVKNSPGINTDMPVAEQRRAERKGRHDWAMALAGEALASVPGALPMPDFEPVNRNGKPFDPRLRTTRVVAGLTLRTADGDVGDIVDFIFDDETWVIRYLVIEIDGGRRVLLPPQLVTDIDIEQSIVTVSLHASAVLSCPALDPATLLTRKYEEAVATHYHFQAYWAA